jgi:Arf-GAP with SH3 domain, ANK repeat and PH domain-containing protein
VITVKDPEPSSNVPIPSFLLRLNNDDELNFKFTFVIRQSPGNQVPNALISGITTVNPGLDAIINGLTFAYASNSKDLDNLVTREFHADPNLHKNSNVQLVGDKFTTDGSPSVQFDWTWKWRQPKPTEDKGGGWRNCCSFLEYDQRAHQLNTLVSFSFWVHNSQRVLSSPQLPSPGFELAVPPRLRVPSSQSVHSRLSDSEGGQNDPPDPPSPAEPVTENGAGVTQTTSNSSVKVDVSCQRPGEDMSAVEDGPLFRATIKALEQKTGNMRTKMKKVLKKAEAAQQAQVECNEAMAAFTAALKDASVSNANAIQPALEHYFEKIARQILLYETQNTTHLQKLIIEPLSRLYNYDIKQAEAKKKDFEDESRDYYAYLSRYLGQRQDSLKEKKRVESDSKYQTKRRNFELRRFDYSSFMQDLHGGRKEQEVLSQLTRYAETQTKGYLETAKKIEEMLPQLDALIQEVKIADKEFQFQRTEREEKRRALEKSTKAYVEPDQPTTSMSQATTMTANGSAYMSDSELGRSDSTGSQLKGGANGSLAPTMSNASTLSPQQSNTLSVSPANNLGSSPGSNKFKGIRDLEEKDPSQAAVTGKTGGPLRKEGLLWALSRPGSHIDPKGINKQAWHK